jgi:NitT/TauT family transport system substrate-binding protein
MRRSRQRYGPLASGAVVLAMAALALGACGSEEDPEETAASGSREPVELSLGLASINMLYAPYVVGDSKGIFEKHGLDINVVLTKDAATTEGAVASAETPIGVITTDAMALAHSANPDVAALMPVVTGTPYSLVTDKKFESPEDLRGQPLAASGLKTADGGIVRTMLAHHGMEAEKDYSILVAGDPASRTVSLQKGRSAGIASPQPQLALLESQGFHALIRAGTIPGLVARPFAMIATTREWAEANRETTVSFLRAWLESVAYTYDPANKAEVIATVGEALETEEPVMTAAYEDWMEDQRVYADTCGVDPAAMQNAIDAAFELGDAQGGTPPDPSALIMDSSFCEEAME